MIRTNIFLTEQMRERLKALSQITGLSSANHVRIAILEYLEKHNGKS